jgi:hypothetical protein
VEKRVKRQTKKQAISPSTVSQTFLEKTKKPQILAGNEAFV